jgi:hypothetical protein
MNNLNNETNLLLNNKSKSHFFIGNIFKNEQHNYIIKNIQKKLRNKYSLKNYHWSNKLCSKLIYLGYLDNNTAKKYMDNIFSNLLQSIGDKFNKMVCKYNKYVLDFDKSYYKISLKFDDDNNYLEKIIVPYLFENGIIPIYDKKKGLKRPMIDLIYFKHSNILDKKKEINIEVPSVEFKIDHLSLIKGISTKSRSGTPSLHDQMNFEEVQRYNFPFKGEL